MRCESGHVNLALCQSCRLQYTISHPARQPIVAYPTEYPQYAIWRPLLGLLRKSNSWLLTSCKFPGKCEVSRLSMKMISIVRARWGDFYSILKNRAQEFVLVRPYFELQISSYQMFHKKKPKKEREREKPSHEICSMYAIFQVIQSQVMRSLLCYP